MLGKSVAALGAALLIYSPQILLAEEAAPTAAPAAQPAPAAQLLSQGQLDALVAPIALYPDALLAEVMMASTYPLEVVEAERWVAANKALKGDALKAAVDKQSWDNSVKSLTATSEVLKMMSEQLSWTQQLGDAVLAQQPDVMDAVQRLRLKAQANNKLVSTEQQTVTTVQEGERQAIVIEPTQPNTVYVPYYDPQVVYGSWPYPTYPPYSWPAYWPPGYVGGGVIAAGLGFGLGYALGSWNNGGYWGGGVNWGNGNININRGNINIGNRVGGGNAWVHNPIHRQGVRYNNAGVRATFGGDRNLGGAQNRLDFGRPRRQSGAEPRRRRPSSECRRRRRQSSTRGRRRQSSQRRRRRRQSSARGRRRQSSQRRRRGRQSSARGRRRQSSQRRRRRRQSSSRRWRRQPSKCRRRRRRPRGRRGSLRRHRRGPRRGRDGRPRPGQYRRRRVRRRTRRRRGGRGGGGRGGGGRGGGGARRSDLRLKHDIVLLGYLDDGLGFYRFTYNGGHTSYVGVMAQEAVKVEPAAVTRGFDGYLRVNYDMLSLPFETYRAMGLHGRATACGQAYSALICRSVENREPSRAPCTRFAQT